MANRRSLKKQIKQETDLLIEDAFLESMEGDKKEKTKMDGIIDEIIDARHDLLSRISSYPKNHDRAKVKEHFNAVRTELADKTASYSKKIGRIG
ncbi:MAG: hypothetical protein RIC95_12780 [Vicingaceae bacterium]